MRKIKFRAWDKNRKAFLDFDWAVDKLGRTFSILDKCVYDEFTDEIELMQFTGLHDKNGKNIYEGDIVSFDDSDGGYEYQDVVINTGIVEYGELGFYFTNRVAVEMDDFYIKDGRCDGIEVIGNIYENPDLLEAEK